MPTSVAAVTQTQDRTLAEARTTRGTTTPSADGSQRWCSVSRDGGDKLLQFNARCVSPEAFEVVERPTFRRKDVQHNVPLVGQNPVSLSSVAFDADASIAVFVLELSIDFICNRMSLPLAGCRGNDEKIHD